MEAFVVTTTNARATTKVDENSNSFVVNELILALKDGFLYPAKIIDMRRLEDGSSGVLIHYQGWNKKYDEWVEEKETCRKMNEENMREQKRLLEEDKEKRRKANTATTIQTTKSGGKSNNAVTAVGNNKNKNKNDDEVLKRKKNATTTKREKSQSTGKDGKKSITKESNSNTINTSSNKTTTTGGAKKKATSKGEGEQQREPQQQQQQQKQKRDLVDAAATEAVLTTKEEDESETNNATTKKKAAPSGGRPSKKQKSEAKTAAEQNAPPTTNKGRKGAVVNATNNTNKRKNAAALEKGAPANAASKEKKNAKKDTAAAPTTNAKKQKQEKEKTETEEQRDRQEQEQQQAPLKPKVKVILATALKKELIKQHEALAHNRVLKLPREPAAHTVQSLFSDYEVEAIAKARTPKQIERAKEIVAGLKRYFDAALQKALLYEKEKKYYDLAVAKNDALKSKPASEICGAEHLLRLYVKLPDFIPVEAFVGEKGEKEAQLIGHQLGETLRWLQKRSHEAFDGAYVEIDETSGKVIREIRKGAEVDDDDDDFEVSRGRRRASRSTERGAQVGGIEGADVEGLPAVEASAFSIDADRARFKAGTLKAEVFKMLEAAWPKLMDANELYEMGTKAGVNVGKNKTVLASGLSHDQCFVRMPGTKNKWALRAHVGLPAGTKRKAESEKEPRERKAKAPRVRGGFSAILESMDGDEKAMLLAWTEKLKQNAGDLKKAKQQVEKAKNALERASKALEEFEANPSTDSVVQSKSAEDILCEPEAPSDVLDKEYRVYTGPDDRKFLIAWRKSVETERARVKRAQDVYVSQRKKEIREASTKLNKKREQLTSAVSKAQQQLRLAEGTVERAEIVHEITRDRIQLMKEKASVEGEDAIKAVNEKITALDEKMTQLFGQKLAAIENQIEREKLRLMAKGERDAERARLIEEKNRLKEEEKAERAKQRETEKAERDKAKAEEKAAKEKAARYPLDDDILAVELAEESKETGVPLETLLKPIPAPVSLANGQVLAEEAFVAEFISVFGAGIQAPQGLTNVEGVNAMFENTPKSRSTLAELYLSIIYEALTPAASGPGRFVARLNRIVNNLNWPEVARKLILHGGEEAHGKKAVEVATKLAKSTWDKLSNADHLVLLRALADLALQGDVCRDIISSRMQQADIFRSERHEARLKAVANRRIVEKAEKEERKRERERIAEEKRAAKAAAEAAKVGANPEGDVKIEEDAKETKDDEVKEDVTMEDASEPMFELPERLREYKGHPDDRHTLMAWKNEVAKVQAELDREREEYESDRSKEVRMQKATESEIKRKKEAVEEEARRKLELEEKRSRDREIKRAAEDAACQVRARPLGMDRHLATYWWNFGGRKDAVYVQSFSGEWGVYNSQEAVDALVDALCEKGVRELGLKKQLEKRKVTIADAFKLLAETQEERDARFAAQLEGGERRSARSRTAPSNDAYVATRPAADLACDEGAVITAARKCMDTMCINAERIGLETDVDWRTFRNKLKNAHNSYVAESLLHLEEKYFECQIKEFKLAAEREKIEREKQPEAPDELSKATLEALVLKHTGKDMSSWKLARRKLAALLPKEIIAEAVEERRRQQLDSEEDDDEDEDEDEEVDDSWNNDENAPEDVGDISIWKGSLQRDQFREYLNPQEDFPVVRIAYAAATLLDATCAFSEEIVHRRELRGEGEEMTN